MRIAFIVSETFMGKRRGGFGWLVRLISGELVKHGFEVFVIAWGEPECPREYVINGVKVITYTYHFETKSVIRHVSDYMEAINVIRDVNADVYVSIEAMVETLLAELFMKNSRHIIWAQDPFDWRDYELMASVDPYYRISKIRFLTNRLILGQAYKKADLILTQARFYAKKLMELYGINPSRIYYLPNPVYPIPEEKSIKKSDEPLICYLGRMDPQKRYWLFFELAKQMPDIKFIAIGTPSILYEDRFKEIERRYKGLNNLELLGFISEGEKQNILNKSWVLVLPSIREGLPIAMLEALAHKAALLSSVNPDGITEKFGYWVKDDNFVRGLKCLLKNDKWKVFGENGYRYVNCPAYSINFNT
ncbi:MAG: glycosyltransferase family 4 protein [Sulfolobales archaeon]|nr:glycosyltransferase family 4 protein [Sulfolobales archaeon]